MTEMINFSKIERKWQKKWEDKKAFETKEKKGTKKHYVLEMYPYPSGSGLHMGHAFNYTIGDIQARLKRMQGFNVLHPMGFDSFGLPAENAAIFAKAHPKKFTEDAIVNYIRQMKELGLSYDWSRKIESHDSSYYKWDQWIFLKMLERGLAYRKKAPVNFCSKCNTVLANEQVVNGKCWRHEDISVEIRHLEQWFFKTTQYADELCEGLSKLDDWPENIKALQRNWIGKSSGVEIDFEINGVKWKVFTTRPDTLFGVTFLVVSAQHPDLMELVKDNQLKEVSNFMKKIKSVKEEDLDKMGKEGVFTGSYGIHPLTGEKIPVYAGNFVVADYGNGIVMGVPAHDSRDFEFAKKYGLPIKPVVLRKEDKSYSFVMGINEKDIKRIGAEIVEKTKSGFFKIKIPFEKLEKYKEFIREKINPGFWNEFSTQDGFYFIFKHKNGRLEEFKLNETNNDVIDNYGRTFNGKKPKKIAENVYAWLAENDFYRNLLIHSTGGILVNSKEFDGLMFDEAQEHITIALKLKGKGRKVTKFRLRDWLISRQRFWGTPIPVVYCNDCGIVPVAEKELPVKLPDEIKFSSVENPLKDYRKFVVVNCPKCKALARRETDTMDTFVNSSWYFLRYTDSQNKKEIFSKEKAAYWMPVDTYIGGKEHACLHLIYFRFYTKFLRDLGLLKIDEPAIRLFNQGTLHAHDGRKMSKSLGNVILPETISDKYGIDAARMFLISVASPDKDINWNDEGIEGSLRFLLRVINFVKDFKQKKIDDLQESKLNRTIRDYTHDLEDFRYNLGVIKLRELFESLEKGCDKKSLEVFLKLLAPIAPHIAEELWEKLGNKDFISLSDWPKFDEKKINDKLEESVRQAEKIYDDINNIIKIISERSKKKPRKVYLYVIPNELGNYNKDEIEKRVGLEVQIYAVNDKGKHDPESKSSKSKPGKPGIYVE